MSPSSSSIRTSSTRSPRQVPLPRPANDYPRLDRVRLAVAAFVRARWRCHLCPCPPSPSSTRRYGGDEYHYFGYFDVNDYYDYGYENDYFVYLFDNPGTTTSSTSRISSSFRRYPDDPLFPHVCTLNPSPTYLCPIFYNMSSIFIIIISSCCIAFVGLGNSNVT